MAYSENSELLNLDLDIYTALKVKHHPNIISEKFFMYDFVTD